MGEPKRRKVAQADPAPIGRPKSPVRSTSVSCWLPVNAHAKLCQIAKEQEQSISSLVKEWLIFKLR